MVLDTQRPATRVRARALYSSGEEPMKGDKVTFDERWQQQTAAGVDRGHVWIVLKVSGDLVKCRCDRDRAWRQAHFIKDLRLIQRKDMSPVVAAPAHEGDGSVKGADLMRALADMHVKSPIAVANKMAFLNRYCDADFVAVTMAGVVIEYEVKVSRADFLRDRHKLRHEIYCGAKKGKTPNHFIYATAPGIITEEDLPPWAGWIEYQNGEFVLKRKAPRMAKGPLSQVIMLRLARAMRRRS